MIKFIKDILTENDNETYCIARVGLAVALLSFTGYAGYQVYNAKDFKYIDFGNGVMQILTGGAAIIGAKQFSGKQ